MTYFCPAARVARHLVGRITLLSNVLLAAGALLLVRPAFDRVVGLRAQSEPAAPAAVPLRARPRTVRRAPSEGDALGRLQIPRIGLDLAVFEGTSDATLRKGPGHLAGTAWPSEDSRAGNCVLAGHRDSFFRPLERARENDLVRLHGEAGVATYRLERRRIVRPRDVSALQPAGDARLTLVTCYPFRWWREAPLRLVWVAVRTDARPAEASLRAVRPAAH